MFPDKIFAFMVDLKAGSEDLEGFKRPILLGSG